MYLPTAPSPGGQHPLAPYHPSHHPTPFDYDTPKQDSSRTSDSDKDDEKGSILSPDRRRRTTTPHHLSLAALQSTTANCFKELTDNMCDFRFAGESKANSGGFIDNVRPGTSNRVILRMLNSVVDRLKVNHLAPKNANLEISPCEGPGQAAVLPLLGNLSIVCIITEQRVAVTGFCPGYAIIPNHGLIKIGNQITFSTLVDAIWETKIRDDRLYDVLIQLLLTAKLVGKYKCFGVMLQPLGSMLYKYSRLMVECDEPFNLDWFYGTFPLHHTNNNLVVKLIDREFSLPVNKTLQHCTLPPEAQISPKRDEFTIKPITEIEMRGCYVGGSYILTSDFGSTVTRDNWNDSQWAPWQGLRGLAIDAAASSSVSPEKQLSSVAQALLTLSETAFIPVYLSRKNRLRNERVLYYNGDSWVISRLEGTVKLEGSLSAQLKVVQVGGTRSIETSTVTGTHRVRNLSQAVSQLVGGLELGTAVVDRGVADGNGGQKRIGKVRNPLSLSHPHQRAKVESATVFAVTLLQEQGRPVGGGACVLDDVSSRTDATINVDVFCCQIARKLVTFDYNLDPVPFEDGICAPSDMENKLLVSDKPIIVAGKKHNFLSE